VESAVYGAASFFRSLATGAFTACHRSDHRMTSPRVPASTPLRRRPGPRSAPLPARAVDGYRRAPGQGHEGVAETPRACSSRAPHKGAQGVMGVAPCRAFTILSRSATRSVHAKPCKNTGKEPPMSDGRRASFVTRVGQARRASSAGSSSG